MYSEVRLVANVFTPHSFTPADTAQGAEQVIAETDRSLRGDTPEDHERSRRSLSPFESKNLDRVQDRTSLSRNGVTRPAETPRPARPL